MGALQFDGVDDYLGFTGLSAALQSLPTGAYTVAVLCARDNRGDSWDGIWSLRDAPNQTSSFDLRASAEWQGGSFLTLQDNGNNRNLSYATGISNDDPVLLVYSKPSGSAGFSASIYDIATGTWEHVGPSTAASSAPAVPSTGGLEFGTWFGTDAFGGRIGVFAAWAGVAMDQAQRMECGANLQTSDLWNHSAGQPASLIEMTSTSPTDLAGGVSSLVTATQATVSADDLGWTYDGIGSTPEVHEGTSAVSGGGAILSTGQKAASASSTTSGGGTATTTAQKAASGSSSASGGGTLTSTAQKAASATSATSGGGSTVSTGEKAAASASATSGAGSVTSSGVKAASASSTATGGGLVASTGQKATSGASTATGGGAIISTGRKATSGASAVSGGGSITTTGGFAGIVVSGTSSVSGGGFVLTQGVKAATGSARATGGGFVASSGSKRASGSSAPHGGGSAIAAGLKFASSASAVTGGGSIASTGTTVLPPASLTLALRPLALVGVSTRPKARVSLSTRPRAHLELGHRPRARLSISTR